MSSSTRNIIQVNGHQIPYTVKKSRRAKHLRLSISGNQLTLTVPWLIPLIIGNKFLHANLNWIKKNLSKIISPLPQNRFSSHQITEFKIQTRKLVRHRLAHYNQYYNFKYSRITIRNQKTRWGSCSHNKTLSFNFRLALLPPELSDYIVVHELCHLKEMNHSSKFWSLVSQTIPNYRQLRRRLKPYSYKLY